MHGGRAIVIVLSVVASAVAAAVLLVPTHPEQGALSVLAALLPPNALQNGSAIWWAAESAGNIALFVPVGALTAAVFGPKRGLLLAVAISACCELAQHWIPQRHASLSDVLLNATGAAVGAAMTTVVLAMTARQARRALPHVPQRQ